MSPSENKTKPPPNLIKTQPIKKCQTTKEVLMERKTQHTFLPPILKQETMDLTNQQTTLLWRKQDRCELSLHWKQLSECQRGNNRKYLKWFTENYVIRASEKQLPHSHLIYVLVLQMSKHFLGIWNRAAEKVTVAESGLLQRSPKGHFVFTCLQRDHGPMDNIPFCRKLLGVMSELGGTGTIYKKGDQSESK